MTKLLNAMFSYLRSCTFRSGFVRGLLFVRGGGYDTTTLNELNETAMTDPHMRRHGFD